MGDTSRISSHCYGTEFLATRKPLDLIGTIFRFKAYPIRDGSPALERFHADWKCQRALAHCFGEQLYQPDCSSQADVALFYRRSHDVLSMIADANRNGDPSALVCRRFWPRP